MRNQRCGGKGPHVWPCGCTVRFGDETDDETIVLYGTWCNKHRISSLKYALEDRKGWSSRTVGEEVNMPTFD